MRQDEGVKKFYNQGFTLIEILVALALLGIILGIVISILIRSAAGTSKLNMTGDVQQEALNGIGLINDRIKFAWFIYPNNSTLTFADDLAVDPISKTKIFTVGTSPILATILPPKSAGTPCTTAATNGCYRFFAYYGTKRSDWVAHATGFKNPGDNGYEPDSWILAEYRAIFLNKPTIAEGGSLPAVPTANAQANILTEGVVPALGAAAPDYRLFTLTTTTVTQPNVSQPADWPLTYVNQVQQDIRLTKTQSGQTLFLPSATETYTLNNYPNNLGLTGMP